LATPSGQGVFRLRITLVDVEPAVWRRLLVPATVRVAKLSDFFQRRLGWTNSHLHSFTIGDDRYGMVFDEHPEATRFDEKRVTCCAPSGEHRRFSYEYDFGDSWEHDVVGRRLRAGPTGIEVRRVHRRAERMPA